MEDLADVFCVGPQPMERWRPYVMIDADGELYPKGWTPQSQNEHLIRKREYHARCAYQYSQLADLAKEQGWEVHTSIYAFRNCALLDMRYYEIALASFQLLTQTTGIDNKTTDRDELYLVAKALHSTQLFFHDTLAKCAGVKKNQRKDILAEAPSHTESKTQLARKICNGIRAIENYYQPTYAGLRQKIEAGTFVDDQMELMAKRMAMVMKLLDGILVILVDKKCDTLHVVQV